MIFITQCDSPALWQTYLSDPASITMEGILIFNQHLLFLLIVTLLLVGLLILLTKTNQPKSTTNNGKKRKRTGEKDEPVSIPEKPNLKPIDLTKIVIPKNIKYKN